MIIRFDTLAVYIVLKILGAYLTLCCIIEYSERT